MRPIEEFTVRHQGKSRIFVLEDNATGVEYIIVHIGDGVCITPRLDYDGELYCGPEPSSYEILQQYLSRKAKLEKAKKPKEVEK